MGIDAFLSVLSKFFLHLVNFGTGGIHKNFLSSGGFHEKWFNASYTLLTGINDLCLSNPQSLSSVGEICWMGMCT